MPFAGLVLSKRLTRTSSRRRQPPHTTRRIGPGDQSQQRPLPPASLHACCCSPAPPASPQRRDQANHHDPRASRLDIEARPVSRAPFQRRPRLELRVESVFPCVPPEHLHNTHPSRPPPHSLPLRRPTLPAPALAAAHPLPSSHTPRSILADSSSTANVPVSPAVLSLLARL
ncbi:hypothetical protein K505DRAFT_20431 [Melanomma pulvis-pyrius CBS 109.77]|uniref:Uncharacterized protein n=1 Tax=Melanomma pulvis-pyrius CBS 109.77 TaxID=1314802 RepID=A0A6A6XFS6_9PLEO|nr:hypothetical protein K505DRAFT_20431 [Melanomma pulvis-pyrius CBS 109.77]